jgi:hypothetical protein
MASSFSTISGSRTRAVSRDAQQVWNSVIRNYISVKEKHPLAASATLDEFGHTHSYKLGLSDVHFACDVEIATRRVLDSTELSPWANLVASYAGLTDVEPVATVLANRIIQQCARIYRDRRLDDLRNYYRHLRRGSIDRRTA